MSRVIGHRLAGVALSEMMLFRRYILIIPQILASNFDTHLQAIFCMLPVPGTRQTWQTWERRLQDIYPLVSS